MKIHDLRDTEVSLAQTDILGDSWDLCYHVEMMLLWKAKAVTKVQATAMSPSYVIRDGRVLRGCF